MPDGSIESNIDLEICANVFKMNRTNKGILDITTNNEVKKYIQNIKAKQYYDWKASCR